MSSIYVLSDQHFGTLKGNDSPNLQFWNTFVSQLLNEPSCTLIIAGDFFDFWISYRDLVRSSYVEILAGFKKLHTVGVTVVYVRGNHDFMDMSHLTEYGVRIVDKEYLFKHNGYMIHVEHGDRLRFTLKHSIVNAVLWSPLSQFLYKLLPANWAIPFALWVAHKSRKRNISKGQDLEASNRYKEIVHKRDPEKGISVTIIGHVHYAALVQESSGWIYANPGSWLKAPTFLVIADDTISLFSLLDNKEGRKVILKRKLGLK